jgi:RNA polymerase sigma factor (TIGR02999 family)
VHQQTHQLLVTERASNSIPELTQLLHAAGSGDSSAQRQLFEVVYSDLRGLARSRLARESPLTLLNPTSLVHESYFRMMGNLVDEAANRRVFFGYAVKVMRSVIVDYVRERNAEKRGGSQSPVTLITEIAGESVDETRIMAIHQAMEQLREIDQRCHDVVELRYFGGFTIEECADLLGVSIVTIGRDWEKARLFLSYQLGD